MSPLFAQEDTECLDCHGESDITMDKGKKTISIYVKKFDLARSVHQKVKCVNCHSGFDAGSIPHKDKITPVECSSCHKPGDLAEKHPFHPKMKAQLAQNVVSNITNCKSCHGTHNIISSKLNTSNLHFSKSTEFCGKCHNGEKNLHVQSEHYVTINKNNPNAPTCIFCHKSPVTPGAESDRLKLKRNQENLCLTCHISDKTKQTQYSKSLVDYGKSVHGSAIQRGNNHAAVCIDCHGSHDLEKASSSTSSVNRFKVPQVCGKCHVAISNEYKMSTHGIALSKGDKYSPGCTYCHGEHSVAKVQEVSERIMSKNKMNIRTISTNKMIYCVGCHTNDTLMAKYNVSTISKAHDWLPNLNTHYETVRCVDCHSSYDPPNLSHNILPPDKTVKQCGQCHSKNSILMTKLYKHEKEKSREKLGFINGTLLSDAIMGIGIHGLMRWYFRKDPRGKSALTAAKEPDNEESANGAE
jgi:hypothetical protein